MTETLPQIRAAVMNGLTRSEVEGLLGRKLDEEEAREMAKTRAVLKLKENDEARQEEAAKAERKAKKGPFGAIDAETWDKTPAKVPKAKFRQAIWQSFGNMSALARLLEVNCSSLRNYMKDHKDLAELMDEARSQLVDRAEEYIASCLADEDLDARTKTDLAKFILKTQGRDRGWAEGPIVQQNIAAENIDLKQIVFGG